jgi:hypothetical protein
MTSVQKGLTGTAVQAIRAMSDAGIPIEDIAQTYGITVAHAQQLCAVRPPREGTSVVRADTQTKGAESDDCD